MNESLQGPCIVNTVSESSTIKLVDALQILPGSVWGHVIVVHQDKWVAVYLYMKGGIEQEKFDAVVLKTNRIIKESWPEPLCTRDHCIGTDMYENRFYTFWLPVLPERTHADFAHFFSK